MNQDQGQRPERVVAGERLSARKFNLLVDEARKNRAGGAPGMTSAFERSIVQVQQFVVYQIKKDFLHCHAYNGTDEDSAGVYVVAKPPQLRASLASHNSVAFTGYSANGQSRTAGGDESQIIIPLYVAGDTIYAIRGITGGVKITVYAGENPGGVETKAGSFFCEWLDLNVDARFWAKTHGDPETCA